MGCCRRRLRQGRWLHCRQPCCRWRRVSSCASRPSHSGISTASYLANETRCCRTMNVRRILLLCQAGVIASCLQCAASTLLTLFLILYVKYRVDDLRAADSNLTVMRTTSLLKWAYLLSAVGLASTKHWFVDLTALRIHRAIRLLDPSHPEEAINALLVCLWMTTAGFAALTLSSPPTYLNELGWHLGAFDAAPIIWSAIMSVGVASFGAIAHAASQAAKKVRYF
jgi:hypothetical protein